MSISTTLNSREWNKFQEVSPGETAVRVASIEDRTVVQTMDVVGDFTVLNVATTTLAASTNHKEGQYSVSFAKAADAAITTAGVYAALSSLNLTRYSGGKIKYWIYLSALTDVASIRFTLGTSSANNVYWTTVDTSLSAGWNEVILDVDSPSTVTGTGLITGDVDYLQIHVTFDAAANALAGILVDSVTIYNPTKIELEVSDIEIGAVELKNASTDDRANILAANTARTTGTIVVATQQVGADGTVPPTGSANTNAPFAKITDGTSNLTLGTATVKTVPAAINDGTTMATVTTGTIKGLNTVISDGTTIPAVLTGTTKTLATSIHDGTSLLTLGAGATKTVPAELNDGTTKIVFGTGATKNVPVGFNDGTTAIIFGTGTQKTVPVAISDGTTEVDVIATINAVKADVSSVAGTVTAVNVGVASAGAQRVALSRDARGNSIPCDYESPQDFAVAYTSNITCTCSGGPITIDDANCTILYLQIKPTAGTSWGARYVNGQDGVSLIAASNVITIYGAGTPFAAGDTYRIGISAQKKGYTAATTSNRSEEVNPLSLQCAEESLVDTTNVAASQQYYPSSLGMAMLGYKNFSITGKYIDGDAVTTTMIIQATNDEDATNADWSNVQFQVQGLSGTVTGTVAGTAGVTLNPGSVATTFVTAAAQTTTFALDCDNMNYRFVRVALLPGDASNTAIIKCRRSY